MRAFLRSLAERVTERAMTGWTLAYTGYLPEQEGLRETLCALGNGYIVSRAAAPDAAARLVGILAVADLARNDAEALVTAMKGFDEPTDQTRR